MKRIAVRTVILLYGGGGRCAIIKTVDTGGVTTASHPLDGGNVGGWSGAAGGDGGGGGEIDQSGAPTQYGELRALAQNGHPLHSHL